MKTSSRSRRFRLWGYLALVLAVAIGVWWFVPNPFIRGLVVGALVAPAVLVLGFVLVVRRMKKRLESKLEPPPLPAGVWDYDMTVADLADERLSFTGFRDKVVVLNFWATWCAPCVAEMPSLERLQESTKDLDVVFACVTREAKDVVESFLAKREIGLPIYLLDGDVPDVFKGRAIPATFILDRSGMIALRHFGAAAWDNEKVVAFVRGLAAAPQH